MVVLIALRPLDVVTNIAGDWREQIDVFNETSVVGQGVTHDIP